jgi:hypothetical protein
LTPGAAPQTIISEPVQTAVPPKRDAVGTFAPVDVGVHESVPGS